LSLPEFSQLLAEKGPEPKHDDRVKKRKLEKWALRLWTCAGAVFYVALYWAIISEIIIAKGHVLGGILFLLVITALSVGGLLILYSTALEKSKAHRPPDQLSAKANTAPEPLFSPPPELPTSVTENTTELLENDSSKEVEHGSL